MSIAGVSEKCVAYAVRVNFRTFSDEAEKTNGVKRRRSLHESPFWMGFS